MTSNILLAIKIGGLAGAFLVAASCLAAADTALDCGTPTRALAFDFQRSLKPDDEFDMTVTVIDVRTRTFVLEIDARTREGDVVFHATLTPICIGRAERRGVAVPEVLRTKLEQYRADHAAAKQPH